MRDSRNFSKLWKSSSRNVYITVKRPTEKVLHGYEAFYIQKSKSSQSYPQRRSDLTYRESTSQLPLEHRIWNHIRCYRFLMVHSLNWICPPPARYSYARHKPFPCNFKFERHCQSNQASDHPFWKFWSCATYKRANNTTTTKVVCTRSSAQDRHMLTCTEWIPVDKKCTTG